MIKVLPGDRCPSYEIWSPRVTPYRKYRSQALDGECATLWVTLKCSSVLPSAISYIRAVDTVKAFRPANIVQVPMKIDIMTRQMFNHVVYFMLHLCHLGFWNLIVQHTLASTCQLSYQFEKLKFRLGLNEFPDILVSMKSCAKSWTKMSFPIINKGN